MLKLNESALFLNNSNGTFEFKICTGPMTSGAVYLVLYSLLICCLVGNVFVVAVFVRDKSLRTSVNYFIVNMSISDLINSTISLSRWITLSLDDSVLFTPTTLSTIFCKVMWISWCVSVFVSIFSMTALAADRFRAVMFPIKRALFSQKRCFAIIAGMWISSFAFCGYFAAFVSCSEIKRALKMFIFLLIFFLLISISVVAVTVLYLRMTIFLYRQKNSLHLAEAVVRKRAQRNRRIITMLLIIVIVFYVVWIPFYVLHFLYYIHPNISMQCLIIWIFNYFLPMLHPVINPIAYFVFNEKYHQGFKEIFFIVLFCNKKSNGDSKPNTSPGPENCVDIGG